jgi:hypothetical protein
MILQQVWNRFTRNWKDFATLGAGPAIVFAGVGLVMLVLVLVTVGPGIFAMITNPGRYGTLGILSMVGGALLFFFMAIVLGVPAGSFVYGGLMGSVVAYRRGEPAALATFWAMGKRYFTRFLGLSALTWVGMVVLTIVTSPLSKIPGLGPLISSALQSIVIVNLALYPAYLMVSEQVPMMDAIGTGFRIITQNVQEACLSGLMMMAFSWALVIIGVIPVLGQIALLGLAVVYGPLTVYYFAERFETNVRPSLGGSAPGQA